MEDCPGSTFTTQFSVHLPKSTNDTKQKTPKITKTNFEQAFLLNRNEDVLELQPDSLHVSPDGLTDRLVQRVEGVDAGPGPDPGNLRTDAGIGHLSFEDGRLGEAGVVPVKLQSRHFRNFFSL